MDNNLVYSVDNLASDPTFNFLTQLTHNEDDNLPGTSPYSDIVNNSVYSDELSFCSNYNNHNDFSMMTLNIQSLPAKFSEFSEFISLLNHNNCAPDVICLQELWQFPASINFNLNDYHPMVYQLRSNSVQGGGVGIYVKKNLNFHTISGNRYSLIVFSKQFL
jgi:hypothetical protein